MTTIDPQQAAPASTPEFVTGTGQLRAFMRRHYTNFNSRETLAAAQGYVDHLDAGGKMMVTLSGAMSTAGIGRVLARMIRDDKVHAITCTGANLEEDIFLLLAGKEYAWRPDWRALSAEDEQALLDQGMNRVTDTCIPEDVIRHIEGCFMEECRNLGIKVLGPHVNESGIFFKVNKEGQIRFGLGAIKGTGESAVSEIISERDENGPYKDIFDFANRVNLRAVNKKTFEALAMSGAYDCFENIHRRQYLHTDDGEPSLIEKAIKYANKLQIEKESAQASLFGGDSGIAVPAPRISPVEPFGKIEMLNIEKEVVGLYISGHPLDQYKFEIEYLCNTSLKQLKELEAMGQRSNVNVGGIVTSVSHRTTKNGKPYGVVVLEDYEDSMEFFLFSEKYIKFKQYLPDSVFQVPTGGA